MYAFQIKSKTNTKSLHTQKNATRVFYCHFSAFGNIYMYKLMCVSVIQYLNRDSVGIYQYNVNKCQAIYASSLGHLIFLSSFCSLLPPLWCERDSKLRHLYGAQCFRNRNQFKNSIQFISKAEAITLFHGSLFWISQFLCCSERLNCVF